MGKKRKTLSESHAESTVSDFYYSVEELREKLGLRPLKPGRTRCLKCEKWFMSPDTVTIRRCDNCKVQDEVEILYLEDLEGDDLLDTALLNEEDD